MNDTTRWILGCLLGGLLLSLLATCLIPHSTERRPHSVHYIIDADTGLCFAVATAGQSHNSGVGLAVVDCEKVIVRPEQ